jgi:hypothetical protein
MFYKNCGGSERGFLERCAIEQETRNNVHHRGTEDTEITQRLDLLCASFVLSVPLW